MHRTLAGLPFAGLPLEVLADEQNQSTQRAGLVVRAGDDRFREPYDLTVGHMECKVSGRDTGGAMAIFEALTYKDDRPVRHLHHEQDEWCGQRMISFHQHGAPKRSHPKAPA